MIGFFTYLSLDFQHFPLVNTPGFSFILNDFSSFLCFFPNFGLFSTCRYILGWLGSILEGRNTLEVIKEELDLGFACQLILYRFSELLLKEPDKVVNIWILTIFISFPKHKESGHLEV